MDGRGGGVSSSWSRRPRPRRADRSVSVGLHFPSERRGRAEEENPPPSPSFRWV